MDRRLFNGLLASWINFLRGCKVQEVYNVESELKFNV